MEKTVIRDEANAKFFEAIVALMPDGSQPPSFEYCLTRAEFKAEHDLTEDQFNDPVNQTLLAIQYPEAR